LERGRLVRVLFGFELAGEPPALLLQRSLSTVLRRRKKPLKRLQSPARIEHPAKAGLMKGLQTLVVPIPIRPLKN
jgi:hypothetical protein